MTEQEKIRKDPYNYIQEWMEGVLLHVGKKAFSILALTPCSLLLPNIPYGSSNIRSCINTMIIAPPGSGKSTLCKKFEGISLNALARRDISPADLSNKAIQMKVLTLIIEDFSQTMEEGYDMVKVIEGILGDEQNVNKSNMRTELVGEVRAVGLICGTPQDLMKYSTSIETGLFSRCFIVLVSHTDKEHSEIGDHINGKIGNSDYSERSNLMEKTAIEYYEELQQIQNSEHPKIKAITGYSIPLEFKTKIGEKWKKLSERLIKELGDKYYIRDLHEFYRILISSALLNIYNRKHDKGILIPNEEDYVLAERLMIQNMNNKYAVEKSLLINSKIRSAIDLKNLINGGISEKIKNLLINISPYGQVYRNLE